MTPIITSLLDLDLYKLTVGQVAFNRFPTLETVYEFTCRNKDKVDLLAYVSEKELREQINALGELRLTDDEARWLENQEQLSPAYINFLENFRFHPSKQVLIERDEENRTYKIRVVGAWAGVILYETLILSIVNEIFERNYTKANTKPADDLPGQIGFVRLQEKIAKLRDYNSEAIEFGFEAPKIIEFGGRRRYSAAWQEQVLQTLITQLPNNLIGTSNVKLAKKFKIKAIGTFGHELPMALQGVYPIQDSQAQAFKIWLEEFGGKLAIALTDTLGDDKFFDKDWTRALANAYDGQRHDSGDPFAYGERTIANYKRLGIDPLTKTIVFSDGLDIDTVIALHRQFRGRIKMVFGIGTNLTNDVGNPVLQIVLKVTYSNGQPVAKLSANPAKASCKSPTVLAYIRLAANGFKE